MAVVTVTSENLAEFQDSFNRIDEVVKAGDDVKTGAEQKDGAQTANDGDDKAAGGNDEAKKGEKEEKPKKRGKLDQRFSELTQRIRDAEARAAAAEAKAREFEAKTKPAEPKKDDGIGPEPDPKSYTDAFDFARDLAKWETAKALRDRDIADAKKRSEEESAKVLKAWQGRLSVARESIDDFDDIVASSELSVSDTVKDAIIESDFGPELLYHFAADDDEAEKLNDMSPKQAVKYLAKLEGKFEAKREAEREASTATEKAKKASQDVDTKPRKAPPEPITPINARSGIDTRTDSKGEFRGSYEEYKALRMAGKI